MGRTCGGWCRVDGVSDRQDEVSRVEAEAGVGLGAGGVLDEGRDCRVRIDKRAG